MKQFLVILLCVLICLGMFFYISSKAVLRHVNNFGLPPEQASCLKEAVLAAGAHRFYSSKGKYPDSIKELLDWDAILYKVAWDHDINRVNFALVPCPNQPPIIYEINPSTYNVKSVHWVTIDPNVQVLVTSDVLKQLINHKVKFSRTKTVDANSLK